MHWKMNTYCPLIKFTFAKKLTDRDSPKRTTYSSPTLKFLFKKLTYFIQPKQDQFRLSSPMGWVPLPRSFPISWYCKLDTGIHKPKVYPELQMQQMLQVDLLLRPANLTDLVPTWHGAPSQVNHCAKGFT